MVDLNLILYLYDDNQICTKLGVSCDFFFLMFIYSVNILFVSKIMKLDISYKPSPFTAKVKIKRVLWNIIYVLLFRPSPRPLHRWRIMLLNLFGATISSKARICPHARITFPWNLIMDDYATLADDVIVYSTEIVKIGRQATVSQYSYLCTATHDYEDAYNILYAKPIIIQEDVWIAADVFVGPGVIVGKGTVVGARSSVFKSLPDWKVCVGNPAHPIKDRLIIRDRRNEKSMLSC